MSHDLHDIRSDVGMVFRLGTAITASATIIGVGIEDVAARNPLSPSALLGIAASK